MNSWQDMFEIVRVSHDVERNDGTSFSTIRFALMYKSTGALYEKRKYSADIDAKRGAAMIFRSYMKSIEKALIGEADG